GELTGGVLSWLEEPGWFAQQTFSTWSRYRRIDAEEQPAFLAVYADGILFQLHDRRDPRHLYDSRRLQVQAVEKCARPVNDILIVGAGSGADVRMFRDLLSPALKLTAVELDEGFVDAARASPWLWESYRTAEIVIREG